MKKELEKQVGNEIRKYLLENPKKEFTFIDLYKDKKFKEIEETDRGVLIKGFLDSFESIGMIDKTGKFYYNY